MCLCILYAYIYIYIYWKMPLIIYWTFPVKIHWERDNLWNTLLKNVILSVGRGVTFNV